MEESSSAGLWLEIGQQLRHPTGVRGRVIGHLMALANRRPNMLAIDALRVVPSDVILELGFGSGWSIRRLAARTPKGRVVGIDQSIEMLSQASRRNRSAIRAGRVALFQGQFSELPFEDGSVDKILATNVAYFFGSAGAELREAHRALRPGGVMAIYVSSRSTMSRWKFVGGETHRTFEVDDLMALIKYGGFDINETTIVPVMLPFGVQGFLARLRKSADGRA